MICRRVIMRKRNGQATLSPARRVMALLAGFVLFLCCLPAAGEEDIGLEELLDLENLETVRILPPGESLKATDVRWVTPSEEDCGHENCYWELPCGTWDEAAVWKALTAPLTVLDYNQRQQYKVRKEPRADCKEYTGEVTGSSQGVHVLERGEEWSLIEAYSSSTEGSKVAVWAEKFQGYVETSLLKEVQVDQTLGVVIDKQRQRLFVYKGGKLYATLSCSTGYYNKSKGTRWNEAPAGEFICISWTGDFDLKNNEGEVYLKCNKAIRINDGILIHEVPMMKDSNENWTYYQCERFLGEKASHGCVRVQEKADVRGVNHKWLWNNLHDGITRGNAPTKVLIWDDKGRDLRYPDDELVLYYNPSRHAQYYHAESTCSTYVTDEGVHPEMEPFFYRELEESPYSRLKPCPACNPELRKADIDTVNKKNNR